MARPRATWPTHDADSRLQVYIERNKRFRLPADRSRDVIMIGPGTGVAPFRGFLQERAASGASGRNWLFFGARHMDRDFLYQTEWQQALKHGALHRMDVAFSRDQAERIYVQQRMREQGAQLFHWLESGAYLYVCGDAASMAPDVHAALLEIVGHHGGRNSEEAVELSQYPDRRASLRAGRVLMAELSAIERIKAASRGLRGTIVESLADPITGALHEDDAQLIKLHGSYQQDDRDLREERRLQKLEPAYSFMIRTRLPGGVCTPQQWLALDEIARRYANGSLRLTTRQAFQLHGVVKRELKTTIAAINQALIDTLAACGDVNRNVMASVLVVESPAHAEVQRWARRLSEHLLPRSRAYHEIWLDGARLEDTPGAAGRGRADPGAHLPAAQIQVRHRDSTEQRHRRVFAGPGLHCHPRGRRAARLQRVRQEAGLAPRTASRPPTRAWVT